MPRRRWPPRMRTSLPPPCFALQLRAEGAQRDFAMIAGAQRLFDASLAVGEQSGEQQARFHLGAGHGHFVIDGFQSAAGDAQRRLAVLRLDLRAHRRERLDHRSMGRRESDSSPIISLVNFCPATMPLSMRMVEPELPQSSGVGGRRQRQAASLHFDHIAVVFRSHVTPSARMQPSVLAQSAPVE